MSSGVSFKYFYKLFMFDLNLNGATSRLVDLYIYVIEGKIQVSHIHNNLDSSDMYLSSCGKSQKYLKSASASGIDTVFRDITISHSEESKKI